MKHLFWAAIAVTLATGSATAADLSAKAYTKAPVAALMPAYDWSGFYVGINGGGGGGRNCWNFLDAGLDTGCRTMSGGLAGGQVGYNWQFGHAVLGLEGSGDWADISGSNVPANSLQGTNHTRVNAIWMATARAGYAWDRTLLYVRGGAAFVREDHQRTCNGVAATGTCLPAGTVAEFASETRTSAVVGAGLEYAVTNNLILGIEGDYLPVGMRTTMFQATPGYNCGAGAGLPCRVAVNENLWTVTGRLSWKFGAPVVAKY